MENKIVLDTSYIVSLVIEADSNHNVAQNILKHLVTYKQWILSNYIYTEVATIISQKLGKKGILEIDNLLKIRRFVELQIDKNLHEETKRIYKKLPQKDISFIDLNTVLLAKKRGIEVIATFDKHFTVLSSAYGLKVLNAT